VFVALKYGKLSDVVVLLGFGYDKDINYSYSSSEILGYIVLAIIIFVVCALLGITPW
jgi:hypothetical protein